ncbi:high mobility group box domain-containing protein, partial [Trametes maxima]
HIKRPPNAFLLFRSQFSKDYHSLHPGLKFKQGRHISPAAAAIWKGMSVEQKETYREQARVIKEEHERKYPGWTCR